MICAGIDAGSRTIKIVLIDAERRDVVASGIADQGVDQDARTCALFERVAGGAGLDRAAVRRIVATGYGRHLVSLADVRITEITCQAAGVRSVRPDAATIIDIGGQDSKVIWLGAGGDVRDFIMNDRCAAGTGRFLEVVADRLSIPLASLGTLAARARSVAPISSMCVVFAETEIVGLLAAGTPAEEIVAGIQSAMASRVAAMAGREARSPVVFAGGVALIPGMDDALGRTLEADVIAAPQPQMTAALGAAILASRPPDA